MKIGLICRCRDEYFIEEFVNHYLNQGVDSLYIIDDDSNNKGIYKNLLLNRNVTIIFEENMSKNGSPNELYQLIKKKYDWIVYVDVDEFITTKKHTSKTIRQELESTFKNSHCIKIPWVMMSCNSLIDSPASILKTNVYRWNHDLKHVNKISSKRKFRCRYDQIEVKCIFRPEFFSDLWIHHPRNPIVSTNIKIVDSIDNKPAELNPYYSNLREKHISRAYLLCYHYRLISLENSKNKIKNSKWYLDEGINLEDLMSTDYSEIVDTTLSKN